ncbi:rhodanese-like domain-containing protein [Candidatus Gracilibacteria bacterium]|nr:rhodanese-like domain-containing protein [Candidatus Gracilibacteria bacterium]
MKIIIFFVFFSSFFLVGCTTQAEKGTENTPLATQKMESIYVDVREDNEWSEGHIQGATHLRLGEIESGNISTLPKDKHIILYCRSGRRSAIALEKLKTLGFQNISDAGGMTSIQDVTIIK